MSETDSNEVNTKLMALLDLNEIKAIPHRFARGLDRADRAIVESCFHKDGKDDHGFFKGSAKEFCDWVMGELKKYLASQHIISTQNVELSGSKAVCESYFLAFHLAAMPDGVKEIIVAGRYLDKMEKRDNCWKISYRHCVFDWNRIADESPISAPNPDPRYIGKRFPEDDSYKIFSTLLK